MEDDSLIKGQKDFKPKRVAIVGNGAIENGAAPLLSLLKSSDSYIGFNDSESNHLFSSNPDFAVLLAHFVFLKRIFSRRLIAEWGSGKVDNETRVILKQLQEFRNRLGESYREATRSGSIFMKEVDKDIEGDLFSNETGVIVINWDEVIWNDAKFSNVIQLHGRCSMPGTLILPTEMLVDENEYTLLKNFIDYTPANEREKKQKVLDLVSRKGLETHLFEADSTATDWLKCADEVIVWGVSFHAYDAELIGLVTTAYNRDSERKKKITLVNPTERDRDVAASLLRAGNGVRVDIRPRMVKTKF